MEQSQPIAPTNRSTVHPLPPIADLFKQSWDLLALQFGRLLLLWLYNTLIYLGVFSAFIILLIVCAVIVVGPVRSPDALSSLPDYLPMLLTPRLPDRHVCDF